MRSFRKVVNHQKVVIISIQNLTAHKEDEQMTLDLIDCFKNCVVMKRWLQVR